MKYNIIHDMEAMMEISGFTTAELADELGVSRVIISNWLNNRVAISPEHIKSFYNLTYKKGIKLNKIKEQFYREDYIIGDEVLLFHGAKTQIDGKLGLNHSKEINDFGNGFYCGESLEQSTMFVATQPESSLYMLKFNPKNLKCKKFSVDRDWMLTIAYYRRRLEEFTDNKLVKKLAKELDGVDYIIAPIADNRMFEIIDNFINGEITDVQCKHCLSATNLGMQYVFISEKALSQVTLLEKCFLADTEKSDYLQSRTESYKVNMDKVKLARRNYRNQGEYIEDIIR